MATIGNVETVYLLSNDSYNTKYETNISKGFSVNSSATYQQVDSAARAIAGLLRNTYDDTILVTKVSVNEVLAE